MSPTAQAAETLVTAKCSDCGLFKRGLTQAEGIKFRAEHQQHEGNMLYVEEPAPVVVVSDPERRLHALTGATEDLERVAEQARRCFHAVPETRAAQEARARTKETYSVRRDCAEAVGVMEAFRAALGTAQQTIADTAPALQAAIVAAQQAHDAPRTLAPISADLFEDRVSVQQEQLDRCRALLAGLRRLVTLAEPRVPLFQAAAERIAGAALRVTRERRLAHATARLAAITSELAQLRRESADEVAVIQLVQRLGLDPGPSLRWPEDLLIPPTMDA